MSRIGRTRIVQISGQREHLYKCLLIQGQPDAQDAVGDVIPRIAQRIETEKEPFKSRLLLRRLICLSHMSFDAFDPVVEGTFLDFQKILRRQRVFQKVLHDQVQRGEVGDEIPYR